MSVPQTIAFVLMSEKVKRQIAFYDECAQRFGWQKVEITTRNDRVHRRRYCKDHSLEEDGSPTILILDCWPTTKTIASFLKHPRQKKTQLFRRECDNDLTRRIFENPRVHTGKGYQRRPDNGYDDNTNQQQPQTKRARDEMDDTEDNPTTNDHQPHSKRRRLACQEGQLCRNLVCPYSHPPRCFYGRRCWFQPNCWFDHTRGLCRYGERCMREDCHFSHRHPDHHDHQGRGIDRGIA